MAIENLLRRSSGTIQSLSCARGFALGLVCGPVRLLTLRPAIPGADDFSVGVVGHRFACFTSKRCTVKAVGALVLFLVS